jgi:hypothetical protein
MTQKKHKLDIFQTLNHISKKDRNFFRDLTDEEKKAFQPLIVMRWLTGTNDARQVYFINELVNPFVFSMYNHKELIYYLMTTCTSGKNQRYNWTKSSSKKSSSTPLSVSVIKDYFNYSTMHAIEALPMLSNDDILEYAEQLGRQKEDITKIKKELKTR